MKSKKIYLSALTLAAGLALVSCSGESTKRNTQVPTGSLNIDSTIATAYNNKFSMNTNYFYNQLRYKGYDVFTNALKSRIYAEDLKAVKEIIKTPSSKFGDLTADTIKALTYSYEDNNETKTVQLTKEKYKKIRSNLLTALNSSLCSSIYSTTSISTLKSKSDSDLAKNRCQYIDTMARQGITVTEDELKFYYTDDTSSTIDEDLTSKSVPYFYNLNTLVEKGILDSTLTTQAEYVSSRRNLYSIANKEEINNPDYDPEKDSEDNKTMSNSNYLFKESSIESTYDSSYKTFGEYNIILIQFNTKREATETMNKLGMELTDANAEDYYVQLYNTYYSYKDAITSSNDSEFLFNVSENESELDELSSDVKTLVTETLEDGQYLKIPRNISDKYIMAYRISTTYEINNSEKQTNYSDLTDEQKAKYDDLIKDNLVLANASSYATTNYNNIIRNIGKDNLEIYDPLFEYKFENSYSSYYEPSGNFDNELLFKFTLNDNVYSYKVDDFFKDAKNQYAATILNTYFQHEYVYEYYYDSYFSDKTHKETQKTNKTTLENAISTFNKNQNSTYPVEIGLETYLLNAYGFNNKEDILKYYYDAKNILSDYNSKYIFDEWSTDDHKVVDGLDQEGIIYNLLTTGNKNYSSLLKINFDHILINIDADGDGSPDDPDQFLANDPAKKADFESSVANLAQAIYKEAIAIYNTNQGNTSIKDILTYIKGQFEEGNKLHSDSTKSWSDSEYTKYNFLLTVESLGDINQSSVSNYVTPFADYVKNVYKTAIKDSEIKDDYENGTFIIYDSTSNESKVLSTQDQAESITKDTLCKTVYGYHLLVLNSYEEAEETKYTEKNDSEGYQTNIKLLINENDKDKEDDNVYVVIENSYNEDTKEVNFKQFFIYYIQNITGVSSTLDSDISSLLSSMYSDVISMYKNSNFQNYVFLDLLNIQSADFQDVIKAEKTYYQNVVTSYDSESIYTDWVNGTFKWSRPDFKEKN